MGQTDALTILQWTSAFYFVMFVISWDFVVGYTGQVSFGHTLFFAAGGYTTALLNMNYGIDPLLGVVIGTFVATLSGLLYAIPALRLEGHYLALFTLLPPLIIVRLFIVFREITGGAAGLPSPELLLDIGSFTTNALVHYYLAFALLVGIFLLTWVITRSDTGQILTAIKESEDAVQSAGFNPAKFKVYSMLLSAAIGGFAGAVFVHTPVGSASPSQLLELSLMLEILLASIIGGFGTITGAVVGGLFIYWGTELARGSDAVIPFLEISVGEIHMILFLSLLLVMVYFLSEGIVPWLYKQGNRILSSIWGDAQPVETDGGRAVSNNGPAELKSLPGLNNSRQDDSVEEKERRKP
jgi:branched-chain amino acid transport system permease protein